MTNLLDLLGRILISALFLISAYDKMFSIDGTMSWMEPYGIPGFLLYPTILLEIILPLFVIVGYQARVSASVLAMSETVFLDDIPKPTATGSFVCFLTKLIFWETSTGFNLSDPVTPLRET